MASLPPNISRYQIVKRLGKGGMGDVFLARDPAIDRDLAIKLLREDVESDELRERFSREARNIGRLRHQNIVVVFDVGEDLGRPFIAMEYIEGRTMSSIIKERAPISLERKLQWIEQLCDGLAYAHRAGTIHRDIKPPNLMIDTEQVLKILDFGIARLGQDTAGMTQAGARMGTPRYMSPEQMTGQPVDRRSDIFAVGAVAYELLAYTPAFPGEEWAEIYHRIVHEAPVPIDVAVQGLKPALVRIVYKALEKDRERRYQTLDEMRDDLVRYRQRPDAQRVDSATPTGSRATLPDAATPATPIFGARRGTDRDAAARLRAQQIERLLTTARHALESGSTEQVFHACQEVLVLDPDNMEAADLSDRAQAALDGQQVRAWLDEARTHLASRRIDQALQCVGQALVLDPTSADALRARKEVDEARRRLEIEQQREAAVRHAVERAESALAQSALDTAVHAADQALALDPAHASAQDVRRRAVDAIAARRRREDDERARAAAEAERQRREAVAEAERQRAAAVEAERQRAAAADRQRAAAAEADRQRRDAAEADRQRREAAEAERQRRDAAERDRQRAAAIEAAERKRRDAAEIERHRAEAEAERQRALDAERERAAIDAERRRRLQADEDTDDVPMGPIEAGPAAGSRRAVDLDDTNVGVGPLAAPSLFDDDVQFTVYRPAAVRPERWYSMLAFAHLAARRPDAAPDEPDPIEEVKRQAQAVLGEQAADYLPLTEDSARPLVRDGDLRLVPVVRGVEFNPPERTFRWTRSVHREEFQLRAGQNVKGQTVRGSLSVYYGCLLVAEIGLAIRVDAKAAAARPEPASAAPYRRIFASYSPADEAVVEEFETYAAAIGDRYPRDVVDLRSGEVWAPRLAQLIDEADVFQLFWSWNSMRSPLVRAEWEHALSLNRPHFVRPLYWEQPFPENDELPPPTLRGLAFSRVKFRDTSFVGVPSAAGSSARSSMSLSGTGTSAAVLLTPVISPKITPPPAPPVVLPDETVFAEGETVFVPAPVARPYGDETSAVGIALPPPPVRKAEVEAPPAQKRRIVQVSVAAAALLAVGLGLWTMRKPTSTPTTPPAGAAGMLSLTILPWANVEIVRKSDGATVGQTCPKTPCLLPLQAGVYNVRLSHPDYPQGLKIDITITPGETSTISRKFDGFDPRRAVDDVWGSGPRQ